ncbi:MAG: hypothetical protein WC764_03430 [Candidatus Paceibacterota bacterium]|jgi:hypothetical protein
MIIIDLKFLVRKRANLFFLIDNLSFPIDSMHRDYNREWLELFGQLSDSENNALEKYRLFKKSIWDRGGGKLLTRFESAFYQFSELDLREEKLLLNILTEEESGELDKIFSYFQGRFELMWENYCRILSNNLIFLENDFASVQQVFSETLSVIGGLYGVNNFNDRIEVFLMMRPATGFSGGRMISRKPPIVMIESGISKPQDLDQINHLRLLLFHELTHACFENERFLKFLGEYIEKKTPLTHFLEKYPSTKTPALATRRAMREMIINSIEYSTYVRGRLEQGCEINSNNGETILNEIRNKKSFKLAKGTQEKRSIILTSGEDTYRYVAWKLEGIVRPYLDNKKRIDDEFLDGVYDVLKAFPDNLLDDLKL